MLTLQVFSHYFFKLRVFVLFSLCFLSDKFLFCAKAQQPLSLVLPNGGKQDD